MDALTVLSIWYTDSGLKTFEAYTLNREWMGQKLRQEASKRRMRFIIIEEAFARKEAPLLSLLP